MKPQLIGLHHAYNSRDLGGYPTADGHHVKAGRLFRTALLHNLDREDLQLLNERHVTRIIDFRDNAEVDRLPDRVPESAVYYHLPVFKEDETGASLSTAKPMKRLAVDYQAGINWMLTAYHDMVSIVSAKTAYREFFHQLLAAGDGEATIFHCTAGKDRTGMAAYFLLRVLGVSAEDAREDYLWTNVYSAARVRMRLAQVKAAGGNEVVAYNVRHMSAALPQYLDTATRLINQQYGGMQSFIHKFLGLSNDDVATLRHHYLA
ncbi:tyrosine-protein phosphatase [uncultured Limosilactobacillus sp.]|uniref:tyrosine-protein phosphatase n=1 Tax=uncultured Limosilactobacillus sp. TaxID=2837629 RepID=UPI0025FAB4FC|nr:tyrosine-protein phosphatase [uncultured Limosilactobacillus sp.]